VLELQSRVSKHSKKGRQKEWKWSTDTHPVEEVSTLVTREPTGCAKRMRRSGLLYTLRSCHMWMDPSLAPPTMRRPVRRERERTERERMSCKEGSMPYWMGDRILEDVVSITFLS
jgi:hypothetical protein